MSCCCLLTTLVPRSAEVREALQVLYLNNDSANLEDLLRTTRVSVKSELVDHVEDPEFKVDVKDVVDEHAFDNIKAEAWTMIMNQMDQMILRIKKRTRTGSLREKL